MEKVVVITGHYGSGKTNLALNLALNAREKGEEVTLCDLDVVNPYFRTADFKEMAGQKGIRLSASDYAGTNLDIPALSGGLEAAVNGGGTVLVDVGGDDAGAMALGRYRDMISASKYTMIYVINAYRYLMKDPADAASLLTDIEKASRLSVTHLVNCSNLGAETSADDIIKTMPYLEETARLCNRPVLFTAAEKKLVKALAGYGEILPVELYVRPLWDDPLR